jgi:hypothetical protein
MLRPAIQRLEYLCEIIPPLLSQMQEDFMQKPVHPGKWSRKQILGHLVDSATNNHHRLVRGQTENRPKIAYDNTAWNESNHYAKMPTAHIIDFWAAYNRHLLQLIRLIPQQKLTREVETGERGNNNIMTLEYVFTDYMDHLEHHLRQVVKF